MSTAERALLPLLVLVLSACGPASTPASGSFPTAGSTTSVSPRASAPAAEIVGDFDLGQGMKLHLDCVGDGSPTIVIDVGNEDTVSGSWGQVFGPLTSVSRVCSYDRANLGRSDPDPGPRTIVDLGDDLVTLLHLADVPGPYVFVGGSFGGNIVGVLAAGHPEEVAGLVFVDSEPANEDPALDPLRVNLTEEQYAACCADPTQYTPPYDSPENTEHIDWTGGHEAELASVHDLPPVPTIVLTATRPDCEPDWPCDAIAASLVDLEALWIEGNPDGEQRLVDSGHVMQREAPQAIIDATRDIVEAVRNS